jgi:hypothetical protein
MLGLAFFSGNLGPSILLMLFFGIPDKAYYTQSIQLLAIFYLFLNIVIGKCVEDRIMHSGANLYMHRTQCKSFDREGNDDYNHIYYLSENPKHILKSCQDNTVYRGDPRAKKSWRVTDDGKIIDVLRTPTPAFSGSLDQKPWESYINNACVTDKCHIISDAYRIAEVSEVKSLNETDKVVYAWSGGINTVKCIAYNSSYFIFLHDDLNNGNDDFPQAVKTEYKANLSLPVGTTECKEKSHTLYMTTISSLQKRDYTVPYFALT